MIRASAKKVPLLAVLADRVQPPVFPTLSAIGVEEYWGMHSAFSFYFVIPVTGTM